MKTRKLLAFSLLCLPLSVMTGCNSGKPSESVTTKDSGTKNESTAATPAASDTVANNQPLTLRVYQAGANISDDEFKTMIADPVAKKFPNVTMQIVRPNAKVSLQDLVASGDFPDMMYLNEAAMPKYLAMGLPVDLNSWAKKYGVDVSQYSEKNIDAIKAFGDKGQLYGLPFSSNFDVLFYNKDLFDKFGVAYPKDGMNWDEVIDLSKRMTRTDNNGVKYEGFYPASMQQFASQLSLEVLDPKTGKASLSTDGWKMAFEYFKKISDSNGGKIVMGNNLVKFNRDRTLAMLGHYGARLGTFEEMGSQGNPLNWDMATYPVFKEKPGVTQGLDTHILLISSTGKVQEEAFKVLKFIVGEEAQTNMTKWGRLSSLKNPEIRKNFGVNLQTLKGKHLDAIFKSSPAKVPPLNYKYDTLSGLLNAGAKDLTDEKADLNTVIRQTEENINKAIEAAENAGGK